MMLKRQNQNRGATVIKGTMSIKMIIMLIIFILLLAGGCVNPTAKHSEGNPDEDGKIKFHIGYSGMHTRFDEGFECIVNTTAEWVIIRGENEHLIEFDKKYNEQFFIDNSLIVYAFSSARPVRSVVTNVSRIENELTVDMIHTFADVNVFWFGIIVIEVANTDLTDVTYLRIVNIWQ